MATAPASTSIWDDPAVKPASSDYMKFVNPGDAVQGTIANLGKHTFPDGKAAIQVTFVEDDQPTLTAGQVILAKALFELRPEAGDNLLVKLVRIEQKSGKTLKHFFVEVTNKAGESRSYGEDGPAF